MSIDPDVVRHIAALARLSFSDDEADRLRGELQGMLAYFGQIAAVPTDDVAPTSHVVPLENVMRDDVARPATDDERDLLLRLSAESSVPFFRVPSFRQGS